MSEPEIVLPEKMVEFFEKLPVAGATFNTLNAHALQMTVGNLGRPTVTALPPTPNEDITEGGTRFC